MRMMITRMPHGRLAGNNTRFWESVERASRFPTSPVIMDDDEKREFPAMSVRVNGEIRHRPRAARPWLPNALTVRPMTRVEARSNEGALKAINAEWSKLRKAPAWDESNVEEWNDVAYEARTRGE